MKKLEFAMNLLLNAVTYFFIFVMISFIFNIGICKTIGVLVSYIFISEGTFWLISKLLADKSPDCDN